MGLVKRLKGVDSGGALVLVITVLYMTMSKPPLTPLPTLYPDLSSLGYVGGREGCVR